MTRATLALLVLAAALAGCASPPADDREPGGPDGDPGPTYAWSALKAAPTPRTEVAAAALGNDVYVIGGFTGVGAASTVVEIYDTAADAWRAGPAYPIPIHHTFAFVHGNAVYVLGGYTTSAFVPTQLAFRLAAGGASWEPVASLPEARGAHAGAVVDGKAYLVGGVAAGGALTKQVLVYDAGADAWSTAPDLPTARDHLAAAAVDGVVYAVGGRLQSLSSNKPVLEAFDPKKGVWETRAPMPTARGGFAAAPFAGALVAVGGEESRGTFAAVEAYDPGSDTWRKLPDLPTPRHGLGVVVAGEKLYAIGGGPNPGFTTSGAVEALAAS
ncbi:MAG TPA: kelch repeat-containing protein [Candidatus Thermoplasmatota archaeon]|nr:kelch repeat-containing protein [Candidatus Thermoplasmatota archaeon]